MTIFYMADGYCVCIVRSGHRSSTFIEGWIHACRKKVIEVLTFHIAAADVGQSGPGRGVV